MLVRSQYRFEKCTAFDYQVVPQMVDFMREVDPSTPYQCNLITSKKIQSASSSKSKSVSTVANNNNNNNVEAAVSKSVDQLDSQFVPRTERNNLEGDNGGVPAYDIKSWKPCTNFVRDKEGKRDSAKSKEPVF